MGQIFFYFSAPSAAKVSLFAQESIAYYGTGPWRSVGRIHFLYFFGCFYFVFFVFCFFFLASSAATISLFAQKEESNVF